MPKPASQTYTQRLPAIGLALERGTESVPSDGRFHLLQHGEPVGAFKTLKAAQEAWKEAVESSGWKPPKRKIDPKEYLVREAAMQEAERFKEYWGNSHKFRAKGGVHRNR